MTCKEAGKMYAGGGRGRRSFFTPSLAVLLACALNLPGTAAAEVPSMAEMWSIIQQQQATIAELRQRLEQAEARVAETDEKVEAATDAIESGAVRSDTAVAAAGISRTSIGGYGELHYSNLANDRTGKDTDEVDFHRFVLFFGHEFSDDVRFFSELEVEHAVSGDQGAAPGAVELEQAWVELDLSANHHLRAGADLLPVGIVNPTHEPDTFFGVERDPVETNIIPTTWWAAGLGAYGEIAPGWNYDIVLHSGLATPTTGANAFLIRKGRQQVARAKASDGALTGRLRYTGMPGLELAVSGQYQSDLTQGALATSATLLEAHIDWRRGPFGLRALYARWDLEAGPALTGAAALGRDQQMGYYVEPSYRFAAPGRLPGEIGVFGRYSDWDNEAGNAAATARRQYTVGMNWWPQEHVVFKFDYQQQDGAAHDDGFNLGLGYQF